ncbi:hypothetical protein B0I37DRAFT_405601 [Chaetomium sp. MPI-CAGE-AT-0009]|nr:hypothetical protein B0I37DRAFT_405601 [Chaetomium sp. MPI-CAGE-AT-0009]
MASITQLVVLGLATFTIPSSATSIPNITLNEFGPSKAAARHNAFDIFNAIHSAMRQWGSSLNHNGMSLFTVTIPPGVLLHHGSPNPTPPAGPEWLAFEIEHAELFAHASLPNRPPPPPPFSNPLPQLDDQHPLTQPPPPHHPNTNTTHGYLQTYLTTHPLPLLYIDGTSAGNTDMGTLDTQDLLLRLNRSSGLWDERGRARALCDLVGAWGLHGVVRMEAGFEVIKLVKARKGGEGRVVDWQGVVDLIVDRYADRLRYMAEGVESVVWMRTEVNGLLNTHIDYSEEDGGYQAALGRCTRFYTRLAIPETQEDHLILAAVETVTHSICSALFTLRKLVVEDVDADEGSISAVKETLRTLMGKLKWTKWKECAACNIDEVCFVPMWPFGDNASYERPNCRNATSLDNGWWDSDTQYWHPIPRMMPPPESES